MGGKKTFAPSARQQRSKESNLHLGSLEELDCEVATAKRALRLRPHEHKQNKDETTRQGGLLLSISVIFPNIGGLS